MNRGQILIATCQIHGFCPGQLTTGQLFPLPVLCARNVILPNAGAHTFKKIFFRYITHTGTKQISVNVTE